MGAMDKLWVGQEGAKAGPEHQQEQQQDGGGGRGAAAAPPVGALEAAAAGQQLARLRAALVAGDGEDVYVQVGPQASSAGGEGADGPLSGGPGLRAARSSAFACSWGAPITVPPRSSTSPAAPHQARARACSAEIDCAVSPPYIRF
jgi:hypothetical protein